MIPTKVIKSSFMCAVYLWLCIATGFGCTKQIASGGTETGHGVVMGTLYEPCGTALSAHADVRLRLAASLADTSGVKKDADSGTTNAKGQYFFNPADTGVYVIEGSDSANNRVLIGPVHIENTDSSQILGPDTLKRPGAIRGKITLSEGGDPRKVLVLSFGVDRLTHVNSDGTFLFTDLAQGIYTLRVLPLMTAYDVLDSAGIVVLSSDTTNINALRPRFTGIPTPKNVSLSYDSLLQTVTLTWNKSDTALVKSYNIYRRNVDSSSLFARINASPVSDTSYRDTTGIQDMTYEYAISAMDSSSNEGQKSATVSTKIKSSFVLVKTIDVTSFSNTVVKAVIGIGNKLHVLSYRPHPAVFVLDSMLSVIDTIGFGSLFIPRDLVIDKNGSIYVADAQNSNVITFDTAGKIIAKFTTTYPPIKLFLQDTLLFVGTLNDIEIFTIRGNAISSFSYNESGTKGIAASSTGGIFVYGHKTISAFSMSGTLTKKSIFNTDLSSKTLFDDNGYLVNNMPNELLFSLDKELYRVSENGVLISKSRFPGIPTGISVNEQENTVYICDLNGNIFVYQR